MNTPIDNKEEYLVLTDIILCGTKIHRQTNELIEANVDVLLNRGQRIYKYENQFVPIPYTALETPTAEKYSHAFIPKYIESQIDFIIRKTPENADKYNMFITINDYLKHVYKKISITEESFELHKKQKDELLIHMLSTEIKSLKLAAEHHETFLNELKTELILSDLQKDNFEEEMEK